MHRSGTSALSGELARLGVYMGKKLVQAQEGVNEKGFWENQKLLEINELLLDKLASSWDDPVATSDQCLPLMDDAKLLQLGYDFIQQEYTNVGLWGMKEPRVSILLPFWKTVFKQLDIEPYYLFMLRHPAEVSGSLVKRDKMSRQKSLMLWLNYNFASYEQTQGEKAQVIDFSELLQSPALVTERIAKFCGIRFDQTQTEHSFIDKKLKRQQHHQLDVQSDSSLYGLADKLYHALKKGDNEAIDRLHQQYKQYLGSLDPVLQEHFRMVKQSEIHFRTVFEEVYYSRYWKLLKGMLKLEKKLSALKSLGN